jgi:hypothetical protein
MGLCITVQLLGMGLDALASFQRRRADARYLDEVGGHAQPTLRDLSELRNS